MAGVEYNEVLYKIHESGLTINGFCDFFSITRNSLLNWCAGKVTPNKKSNAKMEIAMSELKKYQKIQKHPSFGYATQEQIDALNQVGIGPERTRILKQIEEQTKKAGKIK